MILTPPSQLGPYQCFIRPWPPQACSPWALPNRDNAHCDWAPCPSSAPLSGWVIRCAPRQMSMAQMQLPRPIKLSIVRVGHSPPSTPCLMNITGMQHSVRRYIQTLASLPDAARRWCVPSLPFYQLVLPAGVVMALWSTRRAGCR